MASTSVERAEFSGGLEIPARRGVQGPRMRRRLYRSLAVYGALLVVGMMPSWLGWGPAWRAFGLGLILPGAGFLYTSDLTFLALTLVAVGWALVPRTLLSGNVVLVPAIWFAAAIGAALRAPSGAWDWAVWAVPLTALGLLALVFVRKRLVTHRQRRRGSVRNRWLRDRPVVLPRADREPTVALELTPDDLGHLRWALDLALQPVDSFEGFVSRSQLDDSAYRYQCNFTQWAIALAQFVHAPAFDGYLSLAQRNLIEKMTDRRVWGYWRRENRWGNLDLDVDPVRRDNVMYSGYWSLMLEVYASNTGDRRYDEPGSLLLREGEDEVLRYDAGRIADALVRNLASRGGWGMFPCEPGIVYAACNAFAQDALLVRARTHGSPLGDAGADAYTRLLDEEFTAPDGSLVLACYPRLGVTNTLLRSAFADAGVAVYFRPVAPTAAARTWEILRHDLVRVPDGAVELAPGGLDRWIGRTDPANGDRSGVFGKALLALLAREMGDDEVADGLLSRAEADQPPEVTDGRRRFPRASNLTNAKACLARFDRRDGWFDMLAVGPPRHWREGPVLAEAPYPDVLVARASTDGTALSLVLRPGPQPGRRRLVVARLRPGRSYDVTGAVEPTLLADEEGTADVEVDVDGRVEVTVTPR